MSSLKTIAALIKQQKISEIECVFPTINATLRGKSFLAIFNKQ
jgi:hypothetical protein